MLVNVYEDGAGEPLSVGVTLREVMGDDATGAEIAEAEEELRRSGRFWIGGGASPLFFLSACGRSVSVPMPEWAVEVMK